MTDALTLIVAANDFIAEWIRGERPNTPDGFEPFEKMLAADLTVVFPSGATASRSEVVDEIRRAHGTNAAFNLITPADSMRVVCATDDVVVVEALELQSGARTAATDPHARRVTFVCQRSAAARQLEICHLHETILSGTGAAAVDWSALRPQ